MDKDELRWERYQFPGKLGSKKIHSHLLSNQKKNQPFYFLTHLTIRLSAWLPVTVSISKQRFIKPSILTIFKQNIFTIKIIKRDFNLMEKMLSYQIFFLKKWDYYNFSDRKTIMLPPDKNVKII